MDDENLPDSAPVGRLAHRMNNAVSYALTNLNLLAEELDRLELEPETDARLVQLVDEATSGVHRVTEHIRELKVLSWGVAQIEDDGREDTWDEDRRPRRILVIDDEPFILASMRRALRHYDVVLADGGQVAIDMLSAGETFDLVLCDLIMGHVDGLDVYRWIQEHRADLLAKVIFMTAGVFTGEVREFLARSHNPVLHKPFDTKTLRWMIAQAMRPVKSPHEENEL